MTFAIDKIFLPSVGVDLVFNINSLAPYSKSSIIYDVDFKKEIITIAQPLKAFSQKTTFSELHLTAIIHEKNRKARFGVKCNGFTLIDQYLLANKTNVRAVILKYQLPVQETNIRSAFRLPLSTKYIIKSKILYRDLEYRSPEYFSVRDVSLNGISIVIPKTNNKKSNPLCDVKFNEEIVFGMLLVDTDKGKPLGKIPIRTQVTRINPGYSETYILIGLKIISLSNQNEVLLNKFIHNAQVDELKRLSGKN